MEVDAISKAIETVLSEPVCKKLEFSYGKSSMDEKASCVDASSEPTAAKVEASASEIEKVKKEIRSDAVPVDTSFQPAVLPDKPACMKPNEDACPPPIRPEQQLKTVRASDHLDNGKSDDDDEEDKKIRKAEEKKMKAKAKALAKGKAKAKAKSKGKGKGKGKASAKTNRKASFTSDSDDGCEPEAKPWVPNSKTSKKKSKQNQDEAEDVESAEVVVKRKKPRRGTKKVLVEDHSGVCASESPTGKLMKKKRAKKISKKVKSAKIPKKVMPVEPEDRPEGPDGDDEIMAKKGKSKKGKRSTRKVKSNKSEKASGSNDIPKRSRVSRVKNRFEGWSLAEIEKAQKASRKSSAYHVARKAALAAGMSDEHAKEEGKKATQVNQIQLFWDGCVF